MNTTKEPVTVCSPNGQTLREHQSLFHAWKYLESKGVTITYGTLESEYLDTNQLIEGSFLIKRGITRNPTPHLCNLKRTLRSANARHFVVKHATNGATKTLKSVRELAVFFGDTRPEARMENQPFREHVDTQNPFQGWLITETPNPKNKNLPIPKPSPERKRTPKPVMRQVTTTTTVREQHPVTRDDIIGLLRGRDIAVPDNADVIVRVPGGGDWSNTDLHIGRDAPVVVIFTETTTKTE